MSLVQRKEDKYSEARKSCANSVPLTSMAPHGARCFFLVPEPCKEMRPKADFGALWNVRGLSRASLQQKAGFEPGIGSASCPICEGISESSCLVVPRWRWLVLVACIVAIEKEGLLAFVSKWHLGVKPHGRASGSSLAKERRIPPSLAS
jgi:hypothetical protein